MEQVVSSHAHYLRNRSYAYHVRRLAKHWNGRQYGQYLSENRRLLPCWLIRQGKEHKKHIRGRCQLPQSRLCIANRSLPAQSMMQHAVRQPAPRLTRLQHIPPKQTDHDTLPILGGLEYSGPSEHHPAFPVAVTKKNIRQKNKRLIISCSHHYLTPDSSPGALKRSSSCLDAPWDRTVPRRPVNSSSMLSR